MLRVCMNFLNFKHVGGFGSRIGYGETQARLPFSRNFHIFVESHTPAPHILDFYSISYIWFLWKIGTLYGFGFVCFFAIFRIQTNQYLFRLSIINCPLRWMVFAVRQHEPETTQRMQNHKFLWNHLNITVLKCSITRKVTLKSFFLLDYSI